MGIQDLYTAKLCLAPGQVKKSKSLCLETMAGSRGLAPGSKTAGLDEEAGLRTYHRTLEVLIPAAATVAEEPSTSANGWAVGRMHHRTGQHSCRVCDLELVSQRLGQTYLAVYYMRVLARGLALLREDYGRRRHCRA